MAPPFITAIICTRNRAALLEVCLRSVLRQTLPRAQYEVLVVDNGSTDGTPAVCAAHAADGVRCIVEPEAGLSRARNAGWRAAQGELVGYLDDDAQALPGWLAGAWSAFHDVQPAPAWAGGPIDLDWPAPPPAWLDTPLQECLGRLDLGAQPRWLTPRERLGGGNSFYPRALLAALNGFDTRLGRVNNLLLSGEETQLQRRIEAGGGRLYYHPEIRIRHAVAMERLQPAFFYRRYYWGGITDAVIRRTLREHAPAAAAADLPTAAAPVVPPAGGLLGRALRQALAAAGLGPRAARIRGRIYLAYVLGVLRGRWLRVRT